jgi:hypothetical protein
MSAHLLHLLSVAVSSTSKAARSCYRLLVIILVRRRQKYKHQQTGTGRWVRHGGTVCGWWAWRKCEWESREERRTRTSFKLCCLSLSSADTYVLSFFFIILLPLFIFPPPSFLCFRLVLLSFLFLLHLRFICLLVYTRFLFICIYNYFLFFRFYTSFFPCFITPSYIFILFLSLFSYLNSFFIHFLLFFPLL